MARAFGTALNPHSKALIALSLFLRSSSIFRPLSSRIIDLTFQAYSCVMADVFIPEDVFDSIRLPDGEKDEALRLELAVSLYRRGALSFGKARELAGMSKEEFHSVLGDREVERHYSDEDLKDDLSYAKS